MQRRLDGRLSLAATDPPPAQSGRDHLAVVDHHRIARPQQVRQIAHALVVEGRHRPGRTTSSRAGRAARWSQRDPLRRQLEIKQVGAHGAPGSAHRGGSHKPACPAILLSMTPRWFLRKQATIWEHYG